MQKYLRLNTVFFLSLLLLTACQAEESLEDDLVPAIFTPGFAGELEGGTRATNSTWTLNDYVGIYMINGSNYSLSSTVYRSIPYYATSAGTSTTLSPVDTPYAIYYPVDGSTVRFVAYSPYSMTAAMANQAPYNFTDQSTSTKKEAVDFIFYRGTTDRSKTDPIETMTFKHKFSKINISIKQGTNGLPCSDLTMTLSKMPVSATIKLSMLASTEADENAVANLGISTSATTISACTSESATASATVEAIVAPHTGSGNFTGRTFTFNLKENGFTQSYFYDLPDDVTFESGKVYNFDFTLTRTAVELTNTTITNWTGGGVSWNEDYYLNAAQKKLTLSSTASSSNKLVMFSNFPNNPGITFLSGKDPASEPIDWLSSPSLEKTTSGTEHTYTLTYIYRQ